MSKPSVMTLKAREFCKAHPDAKSRELARMLVKEFPGHYKDLEAARGTIRYVRGNAGTDNRAHSLPDCHRPPQKAGWRPECPPSFAEPWVPVQIDGPCRVLSLSDIHCPYHDRKAVEAAVKYGKKLKPDVLLLLGDIADFYRISRWQQDPRHRDMKFEMDSVKQMLGWLRSQFPKSRIVYKLGNHECRWDHFIWNRSVELWNLEALQLHNVLGFESLRIERVDDNPILIGKLAALHGHELPRGMTSPVNQARGTFLRTMHTCLVGHGHRTSTHCESDMFGREVATWSQGCLCDLSPPFARVSKWNLGFSFIEAANDGQFDLSNLRISADYRVRTS